MLKLEIPGIGCMNPFVCMSLHEPKKMKKREEKKRDRARFYVEENWS